MVWQEREGEHLLFVIWGDGNSHHLQERNHQSVAPPQSLSQEGGVIRKSNNCSFCFRAVFKKTARKRKPIISVKEGALFWVSFLKNSAKTEKPWLTAKAFEIVHAVRLT